MSSVSSREGLGPSSGYLHEAEHLEERRETREMQVTLEHKSNWKVGGCMYWANDLCYDRYTN